MSGRQLDFFDLNYKSVSVNKPIRLIELFAGIGSQAKALKNINVPFEHYKVVEFDRFAINSYNAVHGTDFTTQDITQLADLDITNTDDYYYILTYSFPCQDLSIAGKGAGMARGGGTRSGLLWEVERLLHNTKELPQCLLMENVPAILSYKNIKDFNSWQFALERLGYANYTMQLNSKDFGIPQSRERVFMISLLGKINYVSPVGDLPTLPIENILESVVDEKYYLNDKVASKVIGKLGIQEVGRWYIDANIESATFKELANCVQTKQRGKSRRQGEGGFVLEQIAATRTGNDQSSRIYSTSGLSPTISTHSPPLFLVIENSLTGHSFLEEGGLFNSAYLSSGTRRGRVLEERRVCPSITTFPDQILRLESRARIRRLTPKESWRLMGFTDDDYFKAAAVCSDTQLYKQAGNSIVVPVLEAIFKNLNIKGVEL